MKNKIYKIYMSILCSVAMIFGPWSSLKGQNSDRKQQWESLSEGKFDITNNYQVGSYVVMTTVLDKANKPANIDGKISTQPISVWDLESDSFLDFNSNWVGDPMNPVRLFKSDSDRIFITDGVKIVRADVDFENKFVEYEQTFQGNKDSNNVIAFYKGKNNIYFTSSYAKDYVYVCDMLGNVEKTINIVDNISQITSIIEWRDTIYFGYTYVGGLADGSGLAILDPNTGQITKLRDPLWMNNASGCKIGVIEGNFYMETDPGLYYFEPTLFQYKDGSWRTIIVGALLPEETNGKVSVLVRPDGRNANGDTINKTESGIDYDFTNGIVGKSLPKDDPRTLIQFSEEFKTEFWQRHRFMPYVEFIYELDSKTIGFGPNIVAELVNINTTAVKSVELKRLSVYPNPTSGGGVYIQGLQKPTMYNIINGAGQLVLSGKTMSAVDVSSLPTGMYILTTPGSYAKFIKE